MWQKDVDINEVKEIRVKTNVYFGIGAISKISDISKDLKGKGVDKVIVVSGRNSYKVTGAWDHVEKALKDNKISFVNFDKVSPNPTVDQVDEATKMAVEFGAKAVIAIGGGSAIDTGKSVAIMAKYPQFNSTDLYEFNFTPDKAIPVVAINLTHGTGSEANRFAVVTIPKKDYKPAIAYDCIYPYASIDDPQFCIKLSPDQTRYVSVDAVNHVIEAATSKAASPFSINLAHETIGLVSEYLPLALKDPSDLKVRYYLMYAALLGGVAFDNGLLHYTHALEHPLSAVKPDLSHGLGLAMLLPAVVETIYPCKSGTLAFILSPIIKDLEGIPTEAECVARQVEAWLINVGIGQKLGDLGFCDNDISKLTDLAFNTPSLGMLLGLCPDDASKEKVENIYRNSLKKY